MTIKREGENRLPVE